MLQWQRRAYISRMGLSAGAQIEGDILPRAVQLLQDRLPDGWTTEAQYQVGPGNRDAKVSRADALVRLAAPDGSQVRLVIEFKRALVARDLPALLERLASAADLLQSPTLPMVASRYLSASVRAWLERNDVSYVDTTGNVRLVSRNPAVYLRDRGADSDPFRGPGRPRGTLRGVPAGRVVRALADLRPPLPVSRLVKESRASTGATYRVLEFLEEEALVTRGERGMVEQVRWRELLERWSQDYGFQRDNATRGYLQPRGLPALTAALAGAPSLKYAVTGSLAAQQWAAYAPARLATVYVEDALAAAQALGLREVDSGANVLLAAPASDVVFDRLSTLDGVVYAAPSQVAVDLLTGPGRNPSEGQELLEWMESNEPAWRR